MIAIANSSSVAPEKGRTVQPGTVLRLAARGALQAGLPGWLNLLLLVLVLELSMGACFAAAGNGGKLLWQIGRRDHSAAEFALGPGGWRQYKQDGLFVVGESKPALDWPYVQPGPVDAWAGSARHTFTILFGLRNALASGECRLRLDLVDTQAAVAPTLRLKVNGQVFERALANGAGDASLNGQPGAGKRQTCRVVFPASLLRSGDNDVEITTANGSWLVYDQVSLETPADAELMPSRGRTILQELKLIPALQQKKRQLLQPVSMRLCNFGQETTGMLQIEGSEAIPLHVQHGVQTVKTLIPAASQERDLAVSVTVAGQKLAAPNLVQKPVRHLTIYVLPHSHTDIGYTEIQTAIEQKQVNNLLEGIALARKTADYPKGARFVWNVEVLWAADLYLHRLNAEQRAQFFEAVKKGQVALNGMYLNELTGLCRPEELLRLFRYSTELSQQCGVPIDSAMISDVPGYTWGSVTAMSQAGIKYFSTAPNWFDRIGDILVQWENKPFYWESPSGKEKVLVMIPFKGYALSHIAKKLSPELVAEYQEQLDKMNYPYEISYTRWSGHGDNAVPDPAICEFIRDWNAQYVWPKFIISSTSEAFRAFEKRYADKVPVVRGDWTPYWEDGAASSARETALNRASSDRLTQAEALWAMLNPAEYPAGSFEQAWRNVLLYSEHTWGAAGSVWDPESQKTKEQWDIKRSYAERADAESRDLVQWAFKARSGFASRPSSRIDIFNTTSWTRTELVTLSPELSGAGDRVIDAEGKPTPSQRLASGELAFIARAVPPFGSSRYTITKGEPCTEGKVSAQGAGLDNGKLRVRVDERTGGIVELRADGISQNLADTASGDALNDYLYLPGDDLANLQRNGPVKITVKEPGPLVASLLIQSEAPGCRSLSREVRLVAGFDYAELINTVDKERAEANPHPGDRAFSQRGGKESVNFAFPFRVPEGEMQIDIPLAAMHPESEQIPGACKNWFTVGRWVEVANRDFGVTWVTLDAPLIEVGGITATLLGSQKDPSVWRKKVERTQKLYSWVMNNHWGTNYRAYQEGPTVFRYVLRPHRESSPADATRFATGFSQPLLVRPADENHPREKPRLRLSSDDVVVTAMKPSDDGRALIVRLFGASGKDTRVALSWATPKPAKVWLSDTSERPLQAQNGDVAVPGWGLVTLRAELPY